VASLIIALLGITDLQGIEDFTSLQTLNCWGNNLGTLDLSSNTNLVSLYCYNCQLTSLDLPVTGTLLNIECFNNNLMGLDVSGNPNLSNLFCNINPNLGSLNLDNNAALITLECRNTGLTALDVSNNPALVALRCQQNSISTIDLSNNTLIRYLEVTFNALTELDVSMTTQLNILNCHLNGLQTLNIKNGHNDVLNTLNATDNSLTCIQVDDKTQAEGKGGWQKDSGASYEESCPGLGLDYFTEHDIAIFPNPSENEINVQLNSNVDFYLTNLYGQEIKKGIFVTGNNVLDIHDLANGLYFLNFEVKGKVTKKIIKN
jgi:hypothetical protein